jgi:hypothetical protein
MSSLQVPEAASSAQRDFGKPGVVYVMGAGRSGSTILGVALGNCAGVLYAGELDKWLLRSGVPPLGGEERARFWRTVRDRVADAGELFGGEARILERSSDLLRVRHWRRRRRLRERYRRVSQQLLCAISQAAEARFVVDTSHYPLRARELQALAGIDLYLVFLVRDPQSVVASFKRRDVPEPTFAVHASNAYLWLTHLVSLVVFLRQRADRRMFVRYEDFVANPRTVVGQILAQIGASSPVPDFTSLKPGVPFQGNRLLRSDAAIAMSRDASGPAHRSIATSVLQFPWRLVLSWLRPAASP